MLTAHETLIGTEALKDAIDSNRVISFINYFPRRGTIVREVIFAPFPAQPFDVELVVK